MLAKIRTFLREHGWSTAAEIAVNFVLPYVIYLLMQKQFGDVKVLMAVAARSLLIQPFASAAIGNSHSSGSTFRDNMKLRSSNANMGPRSNAA